jgi:hypothetical protein
MRIQLFDATPLSPASQHIASFAPLTATDAARLLRQAEVALAQGQTARSEHGPSLS